MVLHTQVNTIYSFTFSTLNDFQKKMNDSQEAGFLGSNFTIEVACPHILYTHLLANLPAQFLCTEY